jgi:hypothetical protein
MLQKNYLTGHNLGLRRALAFGPQIFAPNQLLSLRVHYRKGLAGDFRKILTGIAPAATHKSLQVGHKRRAPMSLPLIIIRILIRALIPSHRYFRRVIPPVCLTRIIPVIKN